MLRPLFLTAVAACFAFGLAGCSSVPPAPGGGQQVYDQAAAVVASAWGQAIDLTQAAIDDNGSQTKKQLAIKALAVALQAVDLFKSLPEPPGRKGTRALLLADDVGGLLSGDQQDRDLSTVRSALDRWTAILVQYDMPLTVSTAPP